MTRRALRCLLATAIALGCFLGGVAAADGCLSLALNRVHRLEWRRTFGGSFAAGHVLAEADLDWDRIPLSSPPTFPAGRLECVVGHRLSAAVEEGDFVLAPVIEGARDCLRAAPVDLWTRD